MGSWSNLSELIYNLTAAEKRLFTQHLTASTSEGPPAKYARLFSLLASEARTTEPQAIAALQLEGYETRFFSADKRYLYLELLAFLRGQAEAKVPTWEIEMMLGEAKLLRLRGLAQQAAKRLAQAEKKATASENWHQLLTAVELHLRMETHDDHAFQQLQQQRARLNHILHIEHECENLLREMLHLLRESPRLRSGEVAQKGKLLLSTPLLADAGQLPSMRARITWHRIQAAWFFMNRETDSELLHTSAALKMLLQSEGQLHDRPDLAISLFSRILSIGKYAPETEFRKILQSYLDFPSRIHLRNPDQDAYVFGQAFPILLSRYVALNDYAPAFALRTQAEEGLQRHGERILPSARMSIYYGLAALSFAEGDARQALRWVNQILNEFTDSTRPDLYHFTHIFSLVLHLDLGNLSLLEYRVKSVRQAFRKRKQLFATEKRLMDFFQACTKVRSMDDIPSLAKDLEQDLRTLLEDPYERNAHNLFDFFRWLESRRTGKPYLQVAPGPMWEQFRIEPLQRMESIQAIL